MVLSVWLKTIKSGQHGRSTDSFVTRTCVDALVLHVSQRSAFVLDVVVVGAGVLLYREHLDWTVAVIIPGSSALKLMLWLPVMWSETVGRS